MCTQSIGLAWIYIQGELKYWGRVHWNIFLRRLDKLPQNKWTFVFFTCCPQDFPTMKLNVIALILHRRYGWISLYFCMKYSNCAYFVVPFQLLWKVELSYFHVPHVYYELTCHKSAMPYDSPPRLANSSWLSNQVQTLSHFKNHLKKVEPMQFSLKLFS